MTGQVAICAFNTAIAHELEEKVKKIQDLRHGYQQAHAIDLVANHF